MPDIDSLSIRITSSSAQAVNAIDKIIASLSRLNSALNNYADGSQYVKGMDNLVGGLRGVASAVNSIDLNKINSVKSALGSLAGAGEKLTKLNFVSTFTELGSETQKINSAAANTTDSLMKMFNVPRYYKKDLTEAVRAMYRSGDETAFGKASEDVRNLIRNAQLAKKEYSDAYRSVRQTLNSDNFKLYIPKEVSSVWGGDAKSKLATIGIGNWTSDLSQATVFLDELRDVLPEVYMGSDQAAQGMTGIANALVDFLEDEKNLSTVHGDFEALAEELDRLEAKILGVSEGFKAAESSIREDADGFLIADGIEDPFGSDIEVDAQRATNAINNVSAAVTDLASKANLEIANPFEGLIKGLESLQGMEIPADKFAGLQSLSSALSKFGGKNATNALVIIPQVGRAFSQMAAELAKAPAISDNIVRLAEALSTYSRNANTAATSTTRFGTSTNLLGGTLGRLNMPITRSHRGLGSLAAIAGHVYANFFLLIRGARTLGKAMDYSSSMTEAQNVVSVVFGKSSDVMDEFAQTAIKDFGLARLSAVEFASRFQAMGKTMGITSEQVVKANDFIASKISGNQRAYKDLGDSVADVSINLTKLTADIASLYNQDYEDVAKDMQSIYTGMTRPLRKYGLDLTNATLKEWAMSQGLDSNIEKMTQAEKTMLRYQYVMSRTAGAMGDFQKTQDTFANSVRTIKQLLQEVARTIGEALINALKPALLAFRNFLFNFLELTESALNALGKLLGWKEIDFGGASLIEDTEDYADALDDAAGAAKKLKGQLRAIDELNNLTSNNGSGGGGGDLGGVLGAEGESIWDQIMDTDRIYQSNVQNWKDFGQRIANAMKDGLDQVDWGKVYSKSSTFGRNLANFLDGLIDPELWHEFGQTLAGGLMSAISFAFGFGDSFDWDNLGESIGEGINGFFEEFDGGKLAKTLNIWVDGIKTTLKKAAETIDWGEVFTDLIDFFKEIELDTIGFTLTAGATILGIPAITKALGAAIAAHPLELGVITIVAVGGFQFGNKINEKMEEALGTNPETGESRWSEFWFKVFDIAWGVYDTVLHPLAQAIGDLMLVVPAVTKFHEWQQDVKKDWDENFKPILENMKAEWDEWWFGLFDDVGLDNFILTLETWIGDIKNLFENDPKKFWSLVLTSGVSETLIEDWETIFKLLKEKFDTKLGEIKTLVSDWINNEFKPLFDKDTWLGYLDGIKQAFEEIWSSPLEFAKNFFNKVSEWAEPFINGLIDGFAKLFNGKNLLTGGSGTFDVTHISLPKFATGGYPTTGSLFWAGERGAELVGSVNGKTAVASNGEITGITSAIRSSSDAEISLLREQNELLTALVNKEFGISKSELFKSVRSSANEYTRMTGRPAW